MGQNGSGLVSLLNDISTFLAYVMTKSSCVAFELGVHTNPKSESERNGMTRVPTLMSQFSTLDIMP